MSLNSTAAQWSMQNVNTLGQPDYIKNVHISVY